MPEADLIFQLSAVGPRAVYRSPRGLFSTNIFCETCGDFDGDGLCATDNCPFVSNATQYDADGDGVGNPCDPCTDIDGDGIGDAGFAFSVCGTDNCSATPNASQIDSDSDGAGDACDCAANDPLLLRPGAVTGLRPEALGSGATRLTWDPTAGADTYAVTRGLISELADGQYGTCLESGITGTSYDDADRPAAGQGFLYLLRGRSTSCGSGPLGYTSNDGERINLNPGACS